MSAARDADQAQVKGGRESPTEAARPAPRRPAEGPAAQLLGFGIAPLRLCPQYLPARLPVYLGAGALLLVGTLELPVAVGAALGYEALRAWNPLRARAIEARSPSR
jgi:hypothetical protein